MQREEWKYRKKYTSSKYSPGSQHFINLMCGIFLFNNPKCLSLQGSCTGSLSAHANFFHPQYSFAGSSAANRTVVFFLSLGLASFIWCPLALMLEDRAYNFYPSFQRHSLICWPLSCITCPGCLFSSLASLSLLSCPFKCIQWWL